ncbi:MAG TPA: phosphoribosyltransferase family protein [Candidatus Dormibacteraeota bacterium]|nr:phosphoribosyltransferase family protein [Candidatus Dormibacteraeota bacterium]
MNDSMDTARRGTFNLRRRMARQLVEVVGHRAPLFGGRADAGLQLRLMLPKQAYLRPVVLAIPPGGVVVAEPIADQLNAPLDVVVVELLQLPGSTVTNPMGAIAPGASRLLDPEALRDLSVQPWAPAFLAESEQDDLARLDGIYRNGRVALDLAGRSAIVVDDGLTPSLGLLAAMDSVRCATPARVILAAPLIADPVRRTLLEAGIEVVRLAGDDKERAGLGAFLYGEEQAPSEREALSILKRAARRVPGAWQRR